MDTRRLSILSAKEVDNIYSLPRFLDDDRSLYFELSPAENEVVADIRTFSVAPYLILQLGYFKAKQQFFSFEQKEVLPDLRYIINLHYSESSWADFKLPSRPIRDEQQKTILDLFDYRLCSGEIKSELESKA